MNIIRSYIVPAVIVAVIGLLLLRWYSRRPQISPTASEYGEGVAIENLTPTEAIVAGQGVGDYDSVPLESAVEESNGQIRYEIKDDKVRMTVTADLPDPATGQYQVWIKTLDGKTFQRAFILQKGKGGYQGSAAVPAELLPFEVIVSKELTGDKTLEETLLKGVITKPQQ